MHLIFMDPATENKVSVRFRALQNNIYTDWDVTLFGIPYTPK